MNRPPRLALPTSRTIAATAAVIIGASGGLGAQNRLLSDLPVVARVPLARSPDWLAEGFGSMWVVNYRPNRVSRIDPASNTVVAEIPLGSAGCLGIVVALDRVWVPTCGDGTLNEIDPATNQVARRIPVPIAGGREGAFAFSDGSFWIPANVPDSSSADVVRVDPRSGSVIAHVGVGTRTDVVIAGFGAVWAASSVGDVVLRIDPRSAAVIVRVAVGPSPKFMAAGEGALWVQNRRDGSVSRVDPAVNREVARIEARVPTPYGDITVAAGAVWLSVNKTPLTRIDPRTNLVTHQFTGGDGADAVRFGFGSLWIADHAHGELWRIDLNRLPPP